MRIMVVWFLLLAVLVVGCAELLPTKTKVRYRDRPCSECPDSCDKKDSDDR